MTEPIPAPSGAPRSGHSQELAELFGALSAAQAEFSTIAKDSVNPFFNSRYAALATVIAGVRPVLAKHGLCVVQFPGVDEDGADLLVTWLGHRSGQFLWRAMRLHLVKADPQGQGSATTYARRYAFMAALGLAADDDDDGNAASSRATGSVPRVGAAAPEQTERVATAKQRGLILARAGEAALSPPELADLVLKVSGREAGNWSSPEAAESWLKRAMDRLPQRLVDPLIEAIGSVKHEEEVEF